MEIHIWVMCLVKNKTKQNKTNKRTKTLARRRTYRFTFSHRPDKILRRACSGSHSQYTPSWLKACCFCSHTQNILPHDQRPGTERLAVGWLPNEEAERGEGWSLCTPFHCGTLPMGEYCPRWGLVFPPRVKPLWKHPHRSTQNTVSSVTLNPQAQCKVRSPLTLHCIHLGQSSQLVSLLLNLVTDVRRIEEDTGIRIPLKGGSSFPESLCSLPTPNFGHLVWEVRERAEIGWTTLTGVQRSTCLRLPLAGIKGVRLCV